MIPYIKHLLQRILAKRYIEEIEAKFKSSFPNVKYEKKKRGVHTDFHIYGVSFYLSEEFGTWLDNVFKNVPNYAFMLIGFIPEIDK